MNLDRCGQSSSFIRLELFSIQALEQPWWITGPANLIRSLLPLQPLLIHTLLDTPPAQLLHKPNTVTLSLNRTTSLFASPIRLSPRALDIIQHDIHIPATIASRTSQLHPAVSLPSFHNRHSQIRIHSSPRQIYTAYPPALFHKQHSDTRTIITQYTIHNANNP